MKRFQARAGEKTKRPCLLFLDNTLLCFSLSFTTDNWTFIVGSTRLQTFGASFIIYGVKKVVMILTETTTGYRN